MDTMGLGTCNFDDYTLDPRNGRLLRKGVEVPLRPKAFDVLCRLVEAAPDLVTKDRLIAAVWPNVVVGEDSLVQCVREIRIALQDDAQQIVRTVPRRGYAFAKPMWPTPPPVATQPDARSRRPLVLGAAAIAAAASLVAAAVALAPNRAPSADPSVAVLPLRALGGGDSEVVAEALTADLITDLGRAPRMLVIARGSAGRYRDATVDPRTVGRELNVRYLVQGSVAPLGDGLRLNVRLLEAETGRELWADRLDASRDAIDTLRRDAAAHIARSLRVQIIATDIEHRSDLVLRGWYLWQQSRPDSVAEARALLLRAVAADPGSAEAWAVLSFTYVSDLSFNWIDKREGHTADEWVRLADEAAAHAVRLGPEHLWSLGAQAASLLLHGRLDESVAVRKRQLALNPNDAVALHNLAALELFRGHAERVMAVEQSAMRVSPRDPKLHQMMGVVALAELHQGHDTLALEWAERAVALDADYLGGQGYVAAAAAHLGDQARARRALGEVIRLRPAYRVANFREEFARYGSVQAFLDGQERYYDGLRRAGLPE